MFDGYNVGLPQKAIVYQWGSLFDDFVPLCKFFYTWNHSWQKSHDYQFLKNLTLFKTHENQNISRAKINRQAGHESHIFYYMVMYIYCWGEAQIVISVEHLCIPPNMVGNNSDIPRYSGVFLRNISGIRCTQNIFHAEYVGIKYTWYSEAEYCRNGFCGNMHTYFPTDRQLLYVGTI